MTSDSEYKTSEMPGGYTLMWKDNGVGGRVYMSDEIGGGVFVWDTCLVSDKTLMAALLHERQLQEEESAERHRTEKTMVQAMASELAAYTGRDIDAVIADARRRHGVQ